MMVEYSGSLVKHLGSEPSLLTISKSLMLCAPGTNALYICSFCAFT